MGSVTNGARSSMTESHKGFYGSTQNSDMGIPLIIPVFSKDRSANLHSCRIHHPDVGVRMDWGCTVKLDEGNDLVEGQGCARWGV